MACRHSRKPLGRFPCVSCKLDGGDESIRVDYCPDGPTPTSTWIRSTSTSDERRGAVRRAETIYGDVARVAFETDKKETP